MVNNIDEKVTDFSAKAQTPINIKEYSMACNILCKGGKHSSIGDTDKMFETRKEEHQDKLASQRTYIKRFHETGECNMNKRKR